MRRNTGAALVLAIGIVALLLAVGFTYYFVTRGELFTAELSLRESQAEELLRGALNVGIAVLNEDIERHPQATSLDHKWRSLFNGSWIAGKIWGIRYTDAGGNFALKGSIQWKNAIPHIDVARPWLHFENLRGYMESLPTNRRMLYVKFTDGYYEILYNGPRSKEWLFIPRIETLGAPILYDYDAVLMVPNERGDGFEEVPQKVGGLYLYYHLDIEAETFDDIKRDGDLPRSKVPFLLPEFYGRVQYPDETGSPVFVGADKNGKRYETDYFYTPEWVNAWADVDLNGDGLKDAVWMPVGADKLFSGVVLDISGDVREDRNDGIDNNLNGLIDESPDNGVNEEVGPFCTREEGIPEGEENKKNVIDLPDESLRNEDQPDLDELFELGVFVYWGGDDGIDNNCDGVVDDVSEQKVFLTSPLPGVRFKVDWNADGFINEYDKVPDENGNLVYLEVVFPNSFTVRRWDKVTGGFVDYVVTADDVDCLDNDFDLLVNNFETYAYVGPNNLEGFFSITERDDESGSPQQLLLSGPPFVLKGFYQAGSGIAVPMYDRTKVNQDNPIYDYRYAKFAMPGNWNPDDEVKFRAARNASFHEINHFLDVSGQFAFLSSPDPGEYMKVFPVRGRYWDGIGRNFRYLDYTNLLPYIHITHTGEPMCELVGRMAIYIADESSRVNVNYAGGHYLTDFNFSAPYNELRENLRRAYFVPGVSSPWLIGYGLETRFIPDFGIVRARKLWNLLTGTPRGQINTTADDYSMNTPSVSLYYDAVFPGYGAVDDNANAFLLLTNGLDDDGNGVVDDGVNTLLGILEGIDEPGELQQSKPYLNKFAERDGLDNDMDNISDEIGELGDRIISTIDQIGELKDFGEPGTKEFDKVSPTLTTFGLSKEAQIKKFGQALKGVNPLDINYASAVQIASNFLLYEKPRSSVDSVNWRIPDGLEAYYFAQGLRSYEYEWRSWYRKSYGEPGFLYLYDDGMGNPLSALSGDETVFPVDSILKLMQLAVNIVDARDEDIAQTRLTTEKVPGILTLEEKENYIPSQNENSLNPFEKAHNPTNIRLRDLEKYAKETLGEYEVSWAINDEWWANRVGNGGKKDLRTISYTVSGIESVRITELMVRPVRRLETEVPVYRNLYNYYRDEYPPGIPLFLYDIDLLSNYYADTTPLWNLANPSLNLLGIENGYSTNRVYLTDPNTGDPDPNAPNIIEFRIRSTTFLPRGRYYLVLNVSNFLGQPTLTRGGENKLKYAIKYCRVNVNNPDNYNDDILIDPPIIEDVINNPFYVNDDAVFQRVQEGWIGINARNEPTGLVFLPGQLENPNFIPPDGYWLDGVLPEEIPLNGKTFTVMVPNYTPGDGVDNDYVLCIAFWAENIEEDSSIVLNYFDFSQEPDHEYVEVTNVTDKPVNLAGYTLEIGIPRDTSGGRSDKYKVVARISPDSDVVVAPKGKLLLTFDTSTALRGDKFDHFRDPNLSPESILKRNGIGVCSIPSEEPLPPELEFLRNITTPFMGLDYVENVFNRSFVGGRLEEDFVDYNGDGLSDNGDENYPDNLIASTPDYPDLHNYFNGYNPGDENAIRRAISRKPWDRIVALEGVEFPLIDGENTTRATMDDVNNLNNLAKIVLQGGLIPDYPERDGYDNDGDGGYVIGERYWTGTLEKDGIDNNLDGVIDNTPVNQNDPMELLMNEGVDEGRIGQYANSRVYGYGSYEKGPIPIFYVKDMIFDEGNLNVDFLTDPYDNQNPPNRTIGINSVLNPTLSAPYFGTDSDPPQWKAFVERRWNPGDCVVVCLYDREGDLVDGVSYNEYDVVNRNVDDILIAPAEIQLNTDYPSFWIPDCMLWDFYRSLNRKHPEYTGDRFGLSNRWEATDGYYDDWEESTSYFEHLILIQTGPTSDSGFSLFSYTNNKPYNNKSSLDFVKNFYSGTPLGKSYSEIALVSKEFSEPQNSLADKVVINRGELTLYYPYWEIESRANLGILYTGSIGKIKAPVQVEYLMSYPKMNFPIEGKYLFDLSRQNIAFYLPAGGSFWRQVWTGGKVLVSQYQGKDEFSKAIKGTSNLLVSRSKVLTVGTADFVPIRPNPNETGVFPSGVNFEDLLKFDLENDNYPQAWVPVFLFALNDGTNFESYTYPRFADGYNSGVVIQYADLPMLFNASPTGNWLFRNGAFGRAGLSVADIFNKWQLQKRIFAYASYYPTAYPEQNRPEAVFIWDADDGVENGDYAVYICVVNKHQINRLRMYDEQLHSGAVPPQYELFSQFGREWLGDEDYDPTQVKLALEVITDPVQVRGLKPKGSNVPTGLTHPDDWFRTEVGGYQEDVAVYSPDRNGIIIYGQQAAAIGLPKMVRVTQKFIALRVRNVGDEVCYLTHIVLTPSNKSYHKININTFEPYIYTDGTTTRVYASPMTFPGFYYPDIVLSKNADFNNPPYGINPVPTPGYSYSNNNDDISLSALHLSYLLASNRVEKVDGRYYTTLLDLSNTDVAKYLVPLSVQNNYPLRVGDVLKRYEFIADHISLRSDVFEVIALVQIGRGMDISKDGYISYRSNEEFTVQSEAKGRIVYERSVPVARFEED